MNLELLNHTLPVFLIMGVGFLMRWKFWMDEGLDASVMRLALHLLLPCLILDNLIGNEVLNDAAAVFSAIALGFFSIAVGLGLSLAGAPLMGLTKGHGKRTFAITTAIQNYGFLAIPVVTGLFGEKPIGILFLFGVGVELAIWTLAIMTLKGPSEVRLRHIVNAPFVAVVAGLILHYVGAANWIPQPIGTTVHSLGLCGVPMCLLMIGATIADQVRASEWQLRWPTVAGACFLRLALIPLFMLLPVYFLPVAVELKQVMLVQAAMPSAVMPVLLARLYGGHVPTAIQIVVATTLVSVLTTLIVLPYGAEWLGLEFINHGIIPHDLSGQ